jgi:hypothetical protein
MPRILRAAALVGVLFSLSASTQAWAHGDDWGGCDTFDVSFAPSPAVPAYDPFGAEQVREVIVTVKSKSSGKCDVALSFQRPALPPVMSRWSSTLPYAIEGAGGNSLVQTSEWGDCTPANRIDLLDMHKNETRTATVRMRVPAGQVRSAGDYADDKVDLILVSLNDHHQSHSLIMRKRFRPTAKIIAKCVLPPPNPATHNFTGAIVQGQPDPAQTRTSTFSNVQCTAPTKVRLIGSAMQPLAAIAPRSGFDAFINWRAAAAFGNAIATLSTNTASKADSQYKNVAHGPTLNGSISVGINLLKGKPLIAGTYSGTLTVAIDPEF